MFDTVRHLADRLRPPTVGSDAELLDRFATARDEDAFAELVRRHGPMVFGVCRRLTRSHHDAEDAFQAAFLVLAARADTVRPPERLGAWLHGVATNTARKATRGRRSLPLIDVAAPELADDPAVELLDTALLSLPPKYRLPLVLCHLEGQSRREAATALGWPEGTVSGRRARGLKLLGDHLRRRGVGLPAAVGLSVAVPADLMATTIDRAVLVAAGVSAVPAHLLSLTRGVLPMLPLRRAALLVAGLLLGTAGLYALPADDPPPAAPAKPAARPAPRWVEMAKLVRPQPVSRLAYGTNGVAVADHGGNLAFWKADFAGEAVPVLTGGTADGRTQSVERLGFTPDGRWLYGIANGNRALWRFNGADLSGGHGIGGSLAMHHDVAPDGLTFLNWFDYAPKGIHLHPNGWEPAPPDRRELVGVTFDEDVRRAVMSPDNVWLAVALANNTVQMVAREGLKKGTILPVAGGPARDLVFSPDSNRLAVIEPAGAVVVYAHGSGMKLATLAGHEGGTTQVVFHPEGNVLATSGADKTVRLWDAATGKPGQVLAGHTDAVVGVAFSPDGKRLASGSADKTVRVWEFRP